MPTKVVIEWTFTPPNHLEQSIEVLRGDYVMTIGEGKAKACLDAEVYDRDPSILWTMNDAVNNALLAAQLVGHQEYTLSNPRMVRIAPEGVHHVILGIKGGVIKISGGTPDLILTDADGNVVMDTRKDRIEKKRTMAELILQHRPADPLLDALLRSYQASVKDRNNELVHLYEIRDALNKKFGRKARNKLGITDGEWSRLGTLANVEPLRQGRHRGNNAGTLRDATKGELQEARGIAYKMLNGYLALL